MGNPAKDEAWRVLKILALAALALAAAAPAETPQPNNSGKLAPLQFRVTTPSGSGLARYYANGSLEGNAQATRALIMVHGVLRDADYYFDTAIKTVHDARAPRTLVIAPQFVEPEDVAGHAVPAATLRWKSDWPGGD